MRSNLDLYTTIVFCIVMLALMSFFIYDTEATKNLGLVIPIICFICGNMFNQSVDELREREVENELPLKLTKGRIKKK